MASSLRPPMAATLTKAITPQMARTPATTSVTDTAEMIASMLFFLSANDREKAASTTPDKPAGCNNYKSSHERTANHCGIKRLKAEWLRHRDQCPNARTQRSAIQRHGNLTVAANNARSHARTHAMATKATKTQTPTQMAREQVTEIITRSPV